MKKDGVEKKDNTKGKVKGYFMYEKEKQRENHLIVLLVYTFFSLILTGESLLLGAFADGIDWKLGNLYYRYGFRRNAAVAIFCLDDDILFFLWNSSDKCV